MRHRWGFPVKKLSLYIYALDETQNIYRDKQTNTFKWYSLITRIITQSKADLDRFFETDLHFNCGNNV